jgi:hypothetical protein
MTAGAPPTSKYLAIYLNDHLAGSTTGVELVSRIAKENRGNEIGAFASRLTREIQEDRDALLELMRTLDVSTAQAKVAMGWITEKVGRLKLNGELRDYSPLSPLVELEGLSMGIEGKRLLWVALSETEPVAERLGRDRLQELIDRAERQRDEVETHRREAARRALA